MADGAFALKGKLYRVSIGAYFVGYYSAFIAVVGGLVMLMRAQLNSRRRQLLSFVIWFNIMGLFIWQYAPLLIKQVGLLTVILSVSLMFSVVIVSYVLSIFMLSFVPIHRQCTMHIVSWGMLWGWCLIGVWIYNMMGLMSLGY